jgi:thymidylate synthase
MSNYDQIYVDGIREIVKNGVDKADRTSVGGNRSIFGYSYKFDIERLDDNIYTMPFLQLRRFSARIAFWELIWMLQGNTDVSFLKKRNISIWDGNSSVDYLSKINKIPIEPGTIGKGYGYQFRNFNGIDQLDDLLDGLVRNPTGRRHIISLWNPADIKDMALEPCHYLYEFYYNPNGTLNIHQHLRSNDWLLGQPYNAAFAALFLLFVAKITGYEPGTVWFTGTDVHMYDNQHLLALKCICESTDTPTASITVPDGLWKLDDVLYEFDDSTFSFNYEKGPMLEKVDMAV